MLRRLFVLTIGITILSVLWVSWSSNVSAQEREQSDPVLLDRPIILSNSVDVAARNGSLFGAVSDAVMLEETVLADALHQDVLQARVTTVDFTQLVQQNADFDAVGPLAERLVLNLFNGFTFTAIHDATQRNSSGSYTWIGHIENQPLSTVILIIRKQMLYGAVQIAGVGEFAIQPLTTEYHVIQQAGPSTILPEDDTNAVSNETRTEEPAQQQLSAEALTAIAAGSTADDGSLIDVAVVYSDDVADADAQSFAELFIAYTNQAYINSNINQRVWLVDVAEFSYNETGSLNADLNNITNNANPPVGTFRNTSHADLVVFFVSNDGSGPNSCSGLAWLQTSVAPSFEGNGFSAMKACSFGSSVFAHELGHNMGARHDWYVDSATSPFSYAHGYVDTINRFRTIMAYNNRCSALGISCTRAPHFASPNVPFGGATTGVAGGTATSCQSGTQPITECDADVARTLNNTAANTAGFRNSQIVWTGAVNSDWGNTANWSMVEGAFAADTVSRVPRAIDHVYIPSGSGNYPSISAGTFVVRELVIAPGAMLTMNGGTLHVGLRWEDGGGFQGTGGTVVFNGPMDIEVISGSGSTFADLQIGDGVSTVNVHLQSDIDINGNLLIKAASQFQAGSHSIYHAGNWYDEGNGFAAETSTVIFNGSTTQQVDKVTTSTLLTESFAAGDGVGCGCSTVYLPATWTRESSWFGGDLGTGGVAWANDNGWLHSAPVSLKPGIQYTVEFEARRESGTGNQLSVYLGNSPVSSAMTTLLGTAAATSNTYTTFRYTFSVTSAGTYYLGFHNVVAGTGVLMDNVELIGTQNLAFYNVQVMTGSTLFNQPIVVASDLTVSADATANFGVHEVVVEGTVTNNGALAQQKSVPSTVMTEFLRIKNMAGTADKYYGIEILAAGAMGSTQVAIQGNQTCTAGGGATDTVRRCYEITPATAQSAQIRFYYRSAEQNSNSTPQVYHYVSATGSWELESFVARGGSGDALWVTADGIDTYSPFRLADELTASPVAPVVSSSVSGNDVVLTWTTNQVNTAYEIHLSDTPFFAPSSSTLVTTVAANIATYIDTNRAMAGASSAYYQIVALVGGQRANSNEAGAITYPLNNGGDLYSLVALSFADTGIGTAAELAAYIGNTNRLLKWNAINQTFRLFVPPATGDNFSLATGDVVFVAVNSNADDYVTVSGNVVTTVYTLTAGGYNFLMVPLQRGDLTSAAGVAAAINSTTALLQWNTANQTFRLFIPPATGDNFALFPGAPFVIAIDEGADFQWPTSR